MALWRAKLATLMIGSYVATVATTPLNVQVTATDYSAEVKNVSISGAEADVSSVYTFGASAEGIQNAETEESNMTMREFTGTLVYKDADTALLIGNTVAGPSGYTRTRGDTTRTKKAILLTFTDGTLRVSCLLNNAYITKIGDISLDAEGHAAQEIAAKCLALDYYEESK